QFDSCTYDLLKVDGGDWSFTGLQGADLSRAAFKDVRMREADLAGARCAGASFRGVDLSGSSLRGADFSGCDLRGSDISGIDPFTAELARAVIDPFQAVVLARALGLPSAIRGHWGRVMAQSERRPLQDAAASHVTPGYQACKCIRRTGSSPSRRASRG